MEPFEKLAQAGSRYGTKLALIIGPDKPSIYPEYLPEKITPASKKYIYYTLDELRKIANLSVYDPSRELLERKSAEGLLYSMTDTHWNNKGAFLAYSGFSRAFGLPVPDVEFKPAAARGGDLLRISGLKDFPLHGDDNWDVIWKGRPSTGERITEDVQNLSFGATEVVSNDRPLSEKYIWITGDSSSRALRQYFNASFKEVRYAGHWGEKLAELPAELERAERKPDMIVVVRVERSF